VVEAAATKKFHVWAASKIEQGVELLTGTSAGYKNGSGAFDSGTAFARVNQRLSEMAKMLKEFE